MNYKCDWCIHREKSEKLFYCEECSTCTNGENEDVNNNFIPKEEYKVCANCVHCHQTKELVNKEWKKYYICTLWLDLKEQCEPLLLTLGEKVDKPKHDLCCHIQLND